MIINYIKGPTSYEDILTVNGITHSSFKDACVAMSLLEGDEEWHETMKEASLWATANQLRNLFVTLLVHCEVINPLKLWNSYWIDLSEDMVFEQRKLFNFRRMNLSEEEMQSYTLMEIELLLRRYEQSLIDYPGMPKLDNSFITRLSNSKIREEKSYNIEKLKNDHFTQFATLNEQQHDIYDALIRSVQNKQGGLFFYMVVVEQVKHLYTPLSLTVSVLKNV